jgi:hypothetical protein
MNDDDSSTSPTFDATPSAGNASERRHLGALELVGRILQIRQQPLAPQALPPRQLAGLAAGALVALALCGASAGLFQGGSTIALAAFKVPLVAALTVALCAPTLVVSTTLAGVQWSPLALVRFIVVHAVALCAAQLALLPITWLFTVSSRHLATVVLIELSAWMVGLLLAHRLVRELLPESARVGLRFWTLLLLLTSLQAATVLQPVLHRRADEPLFASRRQLFLGHFGDASRIELPAARPNLDIEESDPYGE